MYICFDKPISSVIGIFHDPAELELLADEILALDRSSTYHSVKRYQNFNASRSFAFQV